jgi:hypothetical protein
MLNAESREDFELAVVHGNRDMNDEFAIRIPQDLPKAFIQI